MSSSGLMLALVRWIATLSMVLAVFIMCLYSPFYARTIVAALNRWVPVEVNLVAANSQKAAALNTSESLEPGSDLWIARQAYFSVMKQQIDAGQSHTLTLVHARYKELQDVLKKEKQQQEALLKAKIPLLALNLEDVPSAVVNEVNQADNLALMQKYVTFLRYYPIDEVSHPLSDEIFQDLHFIHRQNKKIRPPEAQPNAIVVLGGGLTVGANGRDIVVNDYTRLRLETTLATVKKYKLPIVLSGVEAPYMQKWLKKHGVDAQLLENRSMNTCENTRFSSLLLQKKGGAPSVILITDAYHMPRTRRLFALNGIKTMPIEAPMPTNLTTWRPSMQNYDHSRRANYELLATLRDVLLGSSDCREVP